MVTNLDPSEFEKFLEGHRNWVWRGNLLEREFTFADFVQAMAFVNKVAEAAESLGHHPDIEIHYNRVQLKLSTHTEGTVTSRDLDLAPESMRSGRHLSRRPIPWLLLLALVVLVGAAFVRAALLEGASEILAGWERSGLPGARPTGSGPTLSFAWPPEVGWNDIRWVDASGKESTCRSLRLGFSFSSALRGKLRFDSVRLTDLVLSLGPRGSQWGGRFLRALPDTVLPAERGAPPAREAMRVHVESLRLGVSGPTVETLMDGYGRFAVEAGVGRPGLESTPIEL